MTSLASMQVATIDCSEIRSKSELHKVIASSLILPDYYGHNWDALIDCLSYANQPESGMIGFTIKSNEILVLRFRNIDVLNASCPHCIAELCVCISYVNRRFAGEHGSGCRVLVDFVSEPIDPC